MKYIVTIPTKITDTPQVNKNNSRSRLSNNSDEHECPSHHIPADIIKNPTVVVIAHNSVSLEIIIGIHHPCSAGVPTSKQLPQGEIPFLKL